MTAGNWIAYSNGKKYGPSSLVNNTVKFTLHSSSYTPALSHAAYAAATNELATAGGYTTGGLTASTKSIGSTGTLQKFLCDDQQWTASGSGITARFIVMRLVGTFDSVVDPLIAYCLLDTTPADVAAVAGATFKVSTPGGGILDWDGATA